MRRRLDSDWKGHCQGWIAQEFTKIFVDSFIGYLWSQSFLTLFFILVTAPNIFSENQYQQLNICEPTIIAQYSQSNLHAGSLNKKEKQEQLSAIWSLCADPEQPLLYKAVCGAQYSCQHRRVCTVLPLKPYHPKSTAKKSKGQPYKVSIYKLFVCWGILKFGLSF